MLSIDEIFYDWVESDEYNQVKEPEGIKEARRNLSENPNKYVKENSEGYSMIDDAAYNFAFMQEKQGFYHGFRLAFQLAKEVF